MKNKLKELITTMITAFTNGFGQVSPVEDSAFCNCCNLSSKSWFDKLDTKQLIDEITPFPEHFRGVGLKLMELRSGRNKGTKFAIFEDPLPPFLPKEYAQTIIYNWMKCFSKKKAWKTNIYYLKSLFKIYVE